MSETTDQSTRVRTAREEQTRDYASMPTAQIAHGFDGWDAAVEVDADELARLRAEEAPGSPTAHTVDVTARFALVDAGTRKLGIHRREDGRLVRWAWKTTFNADTGTVTVYRDAECSILGHTPLPATGPLTEGDRQQIAEHISERGIDERPTTKPIVFWEFTRILDAYLDEVHAAIEHPSWCQQEDCWDRRSQNSVEHTRKIASHEWDHEGLDHTVSAGLTMFSEHVVPGPDDTTDMRVTIESSEMGEVTLLGTPDDFRKLGQYLVTAADDLEWELDDHHGQAKGVSA